MNVGVFICAAVFLVATLLALREFARLPWELNVLDLIFALSVALIVALFLPA